MNSEGSIKSHGGACPLCGGQTIALPAPNPERSVLSDGRLVWQPLRKLSCLQCGATCHSRSLSADDVRAIYAHDYELAHASQSSDALRAKAYAGWLTGEFGPPRTLLEVGCGSGALVRELSNRWPNAVCTGIDPALPQTAHSDAKLHMKRGFIDDLPADTGNFDLIVAVNVIEHMANPAAFLAALETRLAAGGQIAIICPTAEPPNVELLFYDHLYSLTPHALAAAISTTALVARKNARAPEAIGDFQMTIFDVGQPATSVSLTERSFTDLGTTRKNYLEHWINLDSALLKRLGSAERFVAFGGGQAASLLRAYAPRTWARIEMIILDDVGEAWKLDKPVESYADAVRGLGAAAVLIATAPRTQEAVAERLKSDGLRPIRYDDLVSR